MDPAELARVHWGAFSFTPAFVFATGYDTNMERDSPTEDGPSGLETYVVPQVEAFLAMGRARLQGFTAFESAVTYSQADTEGQPVGGLYAGCGGNWTYGLGFGLADGPVRPILGYSRRQTCARPTGFEIGKKSLRIENSITAGSGFRAGQRTSFAISGTRLRIRYDADATYQGSDLNEKLNRDVDSVVGSFRFALTPLTSVGLSADVIRDRFERSPARDADTFRITPGFEFTTPAAVVGSVAAGYAIVDAKDSGADPFKGLVVLGQLAYNWLDNTTVVTRFQRGPQFSYDESLAYYLLTGFDASLTTTFVNGWEVLGDGGTYLLDYRPAGTEASKGKADRYWSFGGALGYRIGNWTRIGSSVELYRRRGFLSYKGVRAAAFVTYGSGRFQRLDRPIPFENF